MLEQQRPSAVSRIPALRRRSRSAAEIRRPTEPGPAQTGSALTAVAEIHPGRLESLDRLLTEIGDDIRNNPHIRFEQLTTVHFMRWVILRRRDGAAADYLALETNYDGTLDAHLADLAQAAGDTLHRIYSHCSGYALAGNRFGPSERVALASFLKARAVPSAAFYVAHPSKSARRIRLEAEVYDAIQAFLDAEGERARRQAPRVLYQRIRDHLRDRGLLAPLLLPQRPPPAREHLLQVGLRLLPLLAGPLLGLPLLLPPLLLKERTDRQWDPSRFDDRFERVPALASQEDRQVQNPLTHLVRVKPGPLRRFAVARVLATIDVLARHYYNQGDLGGIATIHFARWALLDDDRTLLFFSNYDGSWENYLGDFIDIASIGLTSIWSNTVDFPRSFLLLFGGARDEERFKSWTRAHQVYTQVWFSAYPKLTTRNIADNHRVAEGLARELTDDDAIREWLQLV
jgi:hypothetical protein